jgi:DNA-binding GntR family transcriptional regulator
MQIHRQILEACEAGDVARVEELVYQDDLETGRRVAEYLRQRESAAQE